MHTFRKVFRIDSEIDALGLTLLAMLLIGIIIAIASFFM